MPKNADFYEINQITTIIRLFLNCNDITAIPSDKFNDYEKIDTNINVIAEAIATKLKQSSPEDHDVIANTLNVLLENQYSKFIQTDHTVEFTHSPLPSDLSEKIKLFIENTLSSIDEPLSQKVQLLYQDTIQLIKDFIPIKEEESYPDDFETPEDQEDIPEIAEFETENRLINFNQTNKNSNDPDEFQYEDYLKISENQISAAPATPATPIDEQVPKSRKRRLINKEVNETPIHDPSGYETIPITDTIPDYFEDKPDVPAAITEELASMLSFDFFESLKPQLEQGITDDIIKEAPYENPILKKLNLSSQLIDLLSQTPEILTDIEEPIFDGSIQLTPIEMSKFNQQLFSSIDPNIKKIFNILKLYVTNNNDVALQEAFELYTKVCASIEYLVFYHSYYTSPQNLPKTLTKEEFYSTIKLFKTTQEIINLIKQAAEISNSDTTNMTSEQTTKDLIQLINDIPHSLSHKFQLLF